MIAGGIFLLIMVGVLGALGFAIATVQSNQSMLTDKLSRIQVQTGSVAGAQTSVDMAALQESSRKTVESMISVPMSGDIPTFALVDDLTKVSNEPFFRNVQVGDTLFVYPKSKIAILFRPSNQKIINMADISAPAAGAATAQQSAPSESPAPSSRPQKVQMYFSTLDVNAQSAQKVRLQGLPNITVLGEKTIEPGIVTKSRVINVSGDATRAREIANLFDAELGGLPETVSAGDADIVVILVD